MILEKKGYNYWSVTRTVFKMLKFVGVLYITVHVHVAYEQQILNMKYHTHQISDHASSAA